MSIMLNKNLVAKEQHDLHMKSRKVCITARAITASLPCKGQVPQQTTVNWAILKKNYRMSINCTKVSRTRNAGNSSSDPEFSKNSFSNVMLK